MRGLMLLIQSQIFETWNSFCIILLSAVRIWDRGCFYLAVWLLFSGACSLCEMSLQAYLDSSLRKVSRKPNTLWTDCGVTVAVIYCRWRYLYVTGRCHLRGPGQWGDPVRLLSSRQTLRHWGDQLRKSDILTTEMEYRVAVVTSP